MRILYDASIDAQVIQWWKKYKSENFLCKWVYFFLFFLLLYMREQVESQVLGIKAKMAKFILQEP